MNEALRERMCTSKKRYKTDKAAIGSAIRRSRSAGALRVYKCPVCHGWHLTKDVS